MEAIEALLARRSIRRFTRDDVSREDEERLLEAAFAAPSGSNARPWHFVVLRDPATLARLSKVHQWSALIAHAPLCIAVLGREGATYWVEDGAAAAENILMAATALGLGTCWVGIHEYGPRPCDEEVACLEILGTTPDKWRCLCLIAVGHPAAVKAPRSQYQETKVSFERVGRRER